MPRDRSSVEFRWAMLLAVVAWPAQPAAAAPQGDVKDTASKTAKELRSQGFPQSRCAMNATFVNGSIAYTENPDLVFGDKLLFVNNADVSGRSDQDIVDILRGVSPNATIPVRVERDGKQQDLQVACIDAAQDHKALLAGLDLAAKKNFDGCVAALQPIARRFYAAAYLRYQCASVSDRSASFDLSALAHEALELAVTAAVFSPADRDKVVMQLRASQSILGEARFAALVRRTTTWPGGETLFARLEPDWGAFQRISEATLKSTLIDPASAQIEWPYGFTYGEWKPFLQKRVEGYWSCGRINAKNRMGGYTGSTSFVVVLSQSGDVLFSDVGRGGDYDLLSESCARSVKFLPPPPAQFGAPASSTSLSTPSVADELAKLSALRSSGALTEAEFQAAKARVLGSKSN